MTTLDATVTIAGGSTFDVEASNAVTGIINNGTIDVTPGGTLIFDDVDDAGAVGDVDKDEVPNASDNDMLLGNRRHDLDTGCGRPHDAGGDHRGHDREGRVRSPSTDTAPQVTRLC